MKKQNVMLALLVDVGVAVLFFAICCFQIM